MEQDKSNPDNLDNTNTVPEHPQVVAIQTDNNKKMMIILAIVLLLIAGAAVAAFVWPGFLKEKKQAASTPNDTPAVATKQYFYYSLQALEKDGEKFKQTISFVDTATGDKEEQTFTADQPYFMSSLGVNVPVQFEASGKSFVVATSDFDGMEAGEPNTFGLYKGAVGSEPELVLGGKDQLSIADWVFTSDGKEIYYLEQKWGPDRKNLLSTELHKVDVATKKDSLIGTVDRPSDRTHSRLFSVASDNSVRFYSDMTTGIFETKLNRATAKVSTKEVVDKALYTNGSLVQNTLSPDGKKLIYESNSGNGALFTLSVMDIETGTVKELIKASDTRIAYGNVQWSPNSDQIVFGTYPFGIEGQKQVGFKNQLITTTVADAKSTVLLEDASPGLDAPDYTKHFFTVHGWSPDGNYLVYSNNTNLAFYDLAQKKASHKIEVFKDYFTFDSGAGYGWATY